MKRNLSGWGVIIAGLLLAVGGVLAMWSGWDMILLERGWSLFIAGSVALSGGVVTIALGRVIAALTRALEARPLVTAAPTVEADVSAPPSPAPPPSAPVEVAPPAPEEPLAPPPPPIVERSIVERAIVREPVFNEPVFERPVVERTVVREPPITKPGVERPIAEAPQPPLRRQRFGYSRSTAAPPPTETPPSPERFKPAPTEVDRYTSGEATYVMMSDGSVEVHGPGGVQRYASLAELKARTATLAR